MWLWRCSMLMFDVEVVVLLNECCMLYADIGMLHIHMYLAHTSTIIPIITSIQLYTDTCVHSIDTNIGSSITHTSTME